MVVNNVEFFMSTSLQNFGYVVVKSLSKKQKECLKMFNVLEPTNRYKEDIAVPNMIRYARKPHGD